MYHVEKLASDFKVYEDKRVFHFPGIAWGVLDENGNLHFTRNRFGKKGYSVFDYKYVAQHEADHLNQTFPVKNLVKPQEV